MNYSIYGQHLSQAVQATLIAPGAENLWGYATLTGTRESPEMEVHTFSDRDSMIRALSKTFRGRLLSDLYHTVYCFGPHKPLRLRAVIEEDGEGEQNPEWTTVTRPVGMPDAGEDEAES
ncbi:hypothetical protein B1729_14515 [Microbacterium sp. B35-04]|nr:hypothetical protein B1729_14515 [Microbacterium sp. B35-04]